MVDRDENESGEAHAWALWKRLASGSNRERLCQCLGLLDQLSQRVRQRAAVAADEVLEVDRLANGVAMDLCEWDAASDEIDDAKLDRALVAYVSLARGVFERYVEFRTDVGVRTGVALPAGIQRAAATIGLEELARTDGWEFLASIWKPERDRARVAAGRKPAVAPEISTKLNRGLLRWPGSGNFKAASMNPDGGGNLHFVDLAETSWEEAREALHSERELLEDAAESAEPGATLAELDGDDVDEIALAELGPMELGTSAATLALNAAGCPTVSSCAGHSRGHPYISFWMRPAWGPALVKAATTARVGIGNGHSGMAEVFTHPEDLMGLVRLAEELVSSAAEFAVLERSSGPEKAAAQRVDREDEGD